MKRIDLTRTAATALMSSTLIWSPHAMAATPLDELRSTLDDQQGVAVTIYNANLALVKDHRAVTLPAGGVDLAFRDVSAKIRPETALLRSLSDGAGPVVLEQNFDFDLLTPDTLLKKYVGKTVGVIKTHPTTGEETEEKATVLSAANGTVLRIGDRIETGTPGRLVFHEVPPNLRDRPTLVMQLDSPSAGDLDLELTYLTGGLSWQADYVGELSPAEDRMDLTGWVTLENTSGTAYRNAKLQLVAGDVNMVPEDAMPEMMMTRAMVADAAPPMEEEALFEYHLYTLPRATTIADKQTKQVALLRAADVPVTKELVFQGNPHVYRGGKGQTGERLKAGVFVEIDNREESNLGIPLPKGTVRIYKDDSAGNAQFVGEDAIDHTAKNDTVRLKLGEAFDVTAEKVQTEFKKLAGSGPWNYRYESAYKIAINNGKPESVTVKVQEPIPGDWQVLEESQPHEKISADTAVWTLEVPAEDKTTLTYRVRVRF